MLIKSSDFKWFKMILNKTVKFKKLVSQLLNAVVIVMVARSFKSSLAKNCNHLMPLRE